MKYKLSLNRLKRPNTGSSRTAALPLRAGAVCQKWRDNAKESRSSALPLSYTVRPLLFNPNIKNKNFGFWLVGEFFYAKGVSVVVLGKQTPGRLRVSPAVSGSPGFSLEMMSPG
jgi:hypothetical protein